MLFLTLFVLIVVAICVFSVWPKIDGSSANPFRRRTPEAEQRPVGSPTVRPESLESVLVIQLMAGEITRDQYVHAVEGLAARDDERHPLAVPPETGAAGA